MSDPNFNYNPIQGLLRSRKFLLLCLDTIISLTLFFVVKYTAPAMAEDIGFAIAALQPVFVAIILAIAIEDAALKRASGRLPH